MRWVLAAVIYLGMGVGQVLSQTRIFAASSLIDVMGALNADFLQREAGRADLVLVTGSSSALGRQIAAGAGADIFISANREWAEFAGSPGGFLDPAVVFGNVLVVIVGAGSGEQVSLEELPVFLAGSRLALASPDSVPAGQYARQALENAGVWDQLSARLAPADDVRGATRFVASGAARAGVVYGTEAKFPGVELAANIDAGLHAPIGYWMIVAEGALMAAREFADYLTGTEAAAILLEYGFVPNGGARP